MYLPHEPYLPEIKMGPRVTSTCLVSFGHLWVLILVHQHSTIYGSSLGGRVLDDYVPARFYGFCFSNRKSKYVWNQQSNRPLRLSNKWKFRIFNEILKLSKESRREFCSYDTIEELDILKWRLVDLESDNNISSHLFDIESVEKRITKVMIFSMRKSKKSTVTTATW